MSVAIGPIASSDASRASESGAIAQALATGVTAWASHVRVVMVDRDVGGLSTLGAAARRGGARYLLDGDLAAGRTPAAVALRLVDITRGVQVWSRSYALPEAGERRDIVLRRIVDDLAYAVGDAEVRRVLPLPVDELDAMERVVRSYGVIARGPSTANAAEARQLLVEARRREPTLVPALLMMSDALSMQIESDPAPDHDRLVRELDEVSDRAVTLEPGSPIAWAARSSALMLMGRWTAALEAGERRLRLDPLSPRGYLHMAALLIAVDRPADALAMTDRAAALSEDHATGVRWQLRCQARLLLGDAKRAVGDCERAGASFGHDTLTDALLAAAYANAGQLSAAQTTVSELLKVAPAFSIAQLRSKRYSDHPEYLQRVESTWYAGLRSAGVPER
jgi:tetratricopeptide (TPR) repeat protein/TolB-like protein